MLPQIIVVLRRFCRRHPAQTLCQKCPGLVFRFNRPSRFHPFGSCVSSTNKLMSFMHFHNFCTLNCDHHILLIMTGNAQKECGHELLLLLVREQGLYIIKTGCSGEMVVDFTIKEKYLMVSLFYRLLLPLSYLYL